MEKSARHINKQKFQKLSTRQQHKCMARLAQEWLVDPSVFDFENRYAQLHSWVGLDRYKPVPWLDPLEWVTACRDFHQLLAEIADSHPQHVSKLWVPSHQVEVVLDQVKTPYNVGSILRLIDNFGFAKLIHATSWLRWDHPRLANAARGSHCWIPVEYQPDLPTYLKQSKVPVIALEADANAIPLQSWRPPPACKIVLGNESFGVSKAILDVCDVSLSIDMHGYKHSMNVSHALAVFAQFWRDHQLSCNNENADA